MASSISPNRWWRRALGSGSAAGPARRAGMRARNRHRHRHRPEVLALEDRRMLSGYVVTSPGDSMTNGSPTKGTLRWAVEQADMDTTPSSIDITVVAPITLYYGSLSLSNGAEPVTIYAATTATISGNHASNVFVLGSNVKATFDDLTVTGGNAGYGGGIDEDAVAGSDRLTMNDCTVTGNSAYVGGGINFGGTAYLNDCTISNNTASEVGGGMELGTDAPTDTLTLNDCTITGNTSAGDEGGASVGGTATITGCTITGNSAAVACGGLGVGARTPSYSPATVTGCTISGNSAKYGGGLVSYATVNIANCTISGNSAEYGGGMETLDTSPQQATLTNCAISSNSAAISGGGLEVHGPVTLADCSIGENSAGRDGGGVWNTFGPATLTDCAITGNSAGRNGGGVENYLDFTYGTSILDACTISGNSAGQDGGGLYNDSGKATLADCTISENSAGVTAGGMWTSGFAGGAALTACTISANSAGVSNGGLDNERGGPATLTDTIVAGNTLISGAASDIGGGSASTVTGTYDLIGPGGSGGIVNGSNGDIVLTSLAGLGLAPLGDYGGPTPTMALESGSAAIGTGVAVAGIATDQRGFPLDSPKPDIGAFQTQPGGSLVVNLTGDTGAVAGKLDLREAVALADVLGGNETITFDPTVFATPQTIALIRGMLVLWDPIGTIAIVGPAAGVSISGSGYSRVFQVDPGTTAILSDLTITGGEQTGAVNGNTGGGLTNDGTVTITDSTISGNSAPYGGGLSNFGTATLTDCTIGFNSAGTGGGLYNGTTGALNLIACTFASNTGGGLYDASGTATLTDTIVAANFTSSGVASDIAGPAAAQLTGTYDLVGPGGSGGIVGGSNGDIVLTSDQSLGLEGLTSYGGPTPTMALLPQSPAVGAGIAVAGVATDQRGEVRGSAVEHRRLRDRQGVRRHRDDGPCGIRPPGDRRHPGELRQSGERQRRAPARAELGGRRLLLQRRRYEGPHLHLHRECRPERRSARRDLDRRADLRRRFDRGHLRLRRRPGGAGTGHDRLAGPRQQHRHRHHAGGRDRRQCERRQQQSVPRRRGRRGLRHRRQLQQGGPGHRLAHAGAQ